MQNFDVDKFVETAINQFPILNCGLAVLYLQKMLNEGRIINGKFKDNNHTFQCYFLESYTAKIAEFLFGNKFV